MPALTGIRRLNMLHSGTAQRECVQDKICGMVGPFMHARAPAVGGEGCRPASAMHSLYVRALMTCIHPCTYPQPTRIETVAWRPRAFVYHNLLTMAEVDHLVRLGSQRVRPSCMHPSS